MSKKTTFYGCCHATDYLLRFCLMAQRWKKNLIKQHVLQHLAELDLWLGRVRVSTSSQLRISIYLILSKEHV
jgi:hypothetical protein